MDTETHEKPQDALNDAAEVSVKGAIKRGRKRRAGRPSGHTDEIQLRNPITKTPAVPYQKKRRASLIAGDEEPEDESNDEWEEHVELDPHLVEAAVANVPPDLNSQQLKHPDGVANTEHENRSQPSQTDTPLSEEHQKAKKRIEMAARRRMLLLRYSVHIVFSIAHILRLDNAANDAILQGYALSLTPPDTLLSTNMFSEKLSRLALWLRARFRVYAFVGGLENDSATKINRLCSASERAIMALNQTNCDIMDLLTIGAATIRAQGFRCRIVAPLQPDSPKTPTNVKRENKETGRRQMLITKSADDHAKSVLYGWVEVWHPVRSMWTPIDVFSGEVCFNSPADTLVKGVERIAAFDPDSPRQDDSVERSSAEPSGRSTRHSKRPRRKETANVSPALPLRRPRSNIFAHVVAVEAGRVIDVTRRYAKSWKDIEKARAKGKVFEKVIQNLSTVSPSSKSDETIKLELEEFDRMAAEDEVPTSISAIQRHPRYILERHLKRYEIIFPKEPIVGYIKDDPIYLRANVQVLHTKDRWVREMREVTEGATPLKCVRSKNGTDTQVELYGFWQTTRLMIPPCVDGKVPRGIHGNVDVWTPEHLPDGTVHLNIPYARVAARRIGLDFAPAMTGFDVRGGRSIPRIEGIVLAVENADVVEDAARAALAQATERKEQQAKEEALAKWLKLLRAIQARQKVQKRYGGLVADFGTYEAMQKKEGRRNAEMEKTGNVRSTEDDRKSMKLRPEKATYRMQEAHTHTFDKPQCVKGDVMVKCCTLCGLEVSFETL